jgi:hypothetical protein
MLRTRSKGSPKFFRYCPGLLCQRNVAVTVDLPERPMGVGLIATLETS